MLTKNDLQKIGELMDERFIRQDSKFDLKLKKAFRGVVRKKDLKAALHTLENRLTKRINRVLDHCDDRLINHDKRITQIETHLQLPVGN